MNDNTNGSATQPALPKGVTVSERALLEIPRELIDPDPDQPRSWFDENALDELVTSLKANGQILAIVVVRHPAIAGRYMIVEGERRWRAAQIADIGKLRAEVASGTKAEVFLQSAIANFARASLTPLETARALMRIKVEQKVTDNGRLGALFGKSRGWTDMHLKLLGLPKEVLALMDPALPVKKRLMLSIAVGLFPLKRREQIDFAKKFFDQGTSARVASHLIERHRLTAKGATKVRIRPHHMREKIAGFVTRTSDGAGIMASMGLENFAAAWTSQPADEIPQLVDKLETARRDIEAVERYLREIHERSRA